MANANIERTFYPNGQVEWEATIKDGKPIGMVRHWYENGVLKQECPCDENGLEHGVVKDWNKEGELVNESRWSHGTGVSKSWFGNGQLESESHYVHGRLCGRMRMWWEDGGIMSTTYYIRDREVSKKKYDEACKTDTSLPRYEDDASERESGEAPTTYKRHEAPASEWERDKHNEFIKKFLQQPNRGEARQWLAGDKNRTLGEMTHEDSVEFVEEGYRAGAAKIIAVEIEDETTNCLIVELPPRGSKRERVFKWNGESAQRCGFDPYDDWGQNEIFVFLS